ncbi:Bax inhibitor-1/YccA family protein [Spartinivicinus poritis]|uniref:Bax inhibitor-1/YccA family protein n=1 Tax=Spartinivicinus poritis TaxID=2994640 RepID=A0ABT5U5Q2_9GAMM|nr:Bax inhibitor-1/YccA family protein [Spartinivicinus sp. A2-2]MDE1460798.1 Bax inhibitor-1/YccA family protein [Spartinivicinus sp. A2-2]
METTKHTLQPQSIVRSKSTNRVLKNTYLLLSATLCFSAITAMFSATLQLPHPGLILTLAGYFGLLFLTTKFRNSLYGLYCVFALTGFMGYTLGPIIAAYWSMAPMVVMQALGGTAVVFFSLSALALNTKRDFSFLGKSLLIGVLVAFLAGLGALLFEIPALSLAVSAMFVLLMSGMILYETNQIVRGGETNYIMATVSLYVAIFNLFMSLMHLLGFAQSE